MIMVINMMMMMMTVMKLVIMIMAIMIMNTMKKLGVVMKSYNHSDNAGRGKQETMMMMMMCLQPKYI